MIEIPESLTRFTPIPPSCPIPRNVVGVIGGELGYPAPRYVLWKNRQDVTVQAPNLDHTLDARVGPDDQDYEFQLLKAVKINAHWLEIIVSSYRLSLLVRFLKLTARYFQQSLLDRIEFGTTNWAYLVPNTREGGYTIIHRERAMPKITCPLWAPLIFEDEVEFTVWGTKYDRRGIWDGKEVGTYYVMLLGRDQHLNFALITSRCLVRHGRSTILSPSARYARNPSCRWNGSYI